MLSSLIFATIQLSTASAPLFNPLDAQKANQLSVETVPGEPSTLLLALLGLGIIAVYVVVTRRVRPPQLTKDKSAHSLGKDRTTPFKRSAA
jgi:hypothetical protein